MTREKQSSWHKILLASVLAAAGAATALSAATPAPTPAVAVAPGHFTNLKDAFAGKFLIGTAADPGNYTDAEQANIKENYNIITPENCMKPGPIHPSEDTYAWERPDALVKWCEDNKIQVWGHNLCWHAQAAQWMFTGPDGGQVSKDLLIQRLKSHIMAVVGRYKGRIRGWDAVNEAINDGGNGLNGAENLRRSPWSTIIGPEFLTICFKTAHEADPKTELYYNDYNIESGAKHTASMALLKRLIADGAPITGVGIQGHWSSNPPLQAVDKAIQDYKSLGLKVSITELDITMTGQNSGAMPTGGRGGAAPAAGAGGNNAALERQAQAYVNLFKIFLKYPDTIERVTFWGTNDRRSWRSGQSPLLFDGQLQPKPAYQALLDLANGKEPLAQ